MSGHLHPRSEFRMKNVKFFPGITHIVYISDMSIFIAFIDLTPAFVGEQKYGFNPGGSLGQHTQSSRRSHRTDRNISTAKFHHPVIQFRKLFFHHLDRSEEHTSELQSRENLVCRLLLEKKKIRT